MNKDDVNVFEQMIKNQNFVLHEVRTQLEKLLVANHKLKDELDFYKKDKKTLKKELEALKNQIKKTDLYAKDITFSTLAKKLFKISQ